MNVVKLGRKGQVSLPQAILRKLSLQGQATLLVEATEDGAILLRPAAVYPIELYSDARVKAFEKADRLSAREAERLRKALARRKR
jgi:AbrB family looped-hinge helix DNA binding protein